MQTSRRAKRPAAETRAEILNAAETCFASIGFSATRLDDIAEQVGVQRAAIFYYFKDKRELGGATLERLAADLTVRLHDELSQPTSLPEQLESCMAALVDFLSERPAFSHLVLRLASEAPFENHSDARAFASPFLGILEDLLAKGERTGLLRPVMRDPLQLASTLVGATIFRVAAMPVFADSENSAPPAPGRLEAHRREVLSLLRSLLGLPAREDA
ncbi:MAG: TetR/AcrR family transcriptional regulator [Deltaproteobacteria bacterium]|nr:TetR/AcrR family transcriptional regulator [Deltaproteobacteria bacterium]